MLVQCKYGAVINIDNNFLYNMVIQTKYMLVQRKDGAVINI